MLRILTDDGADLTFIMRETYDIEVLPIGLNDGDHEFEAGRSMDVDTFYDNMRAGVQYATSRVSVPIMESAFRHYLEKGDEILYIALSSALSGTWEGAAILERDLDKEFPDKLRIVDSHAASFGEGLLAIKASILRSRGESLDAIADYIEKIKTESFEFFTVGSLDYLHRGGRVSKATKVASGMLQIFPILETNKESGELKVIDVHRGVKGLLKKLKQYMNDKSENGVFNPNQTVYVYGGDWQERVDTIKQFLIDEMGVKEENVFTDLRVGSIIGAHTGPEIAIVTFGGGVDDLSIVPHRL